MCHRWIHIQWIIQGDSIFPSLSIRCFLHDIISSHFILLHATNSSSIVKALILLDKISIATTPCNTKGVVRPSFPPLAVTGAKHFILSCQSSTPCSIYGETNSRGRLSTPCLIIKPEPISL